MDTIDGMRTFVAVARQKSFTSGAKCVSVSFSSIFKRASIPLKSKHLYRQFF